jgi:hypothetical protein
MCDINYNIPAKFSASVLDTKYGAERATQPALLKVSTSLPSVFGEVN